MTASQPSQPAAARAARRIVPGVRVVGAVQLAGLVTVTGESPVNRTDPTAASIQAGYTVLA